MRKNLEIRTTSDGKFYVAMQFRPVGEDMFDTAEHFARFEDRADAERLIDNIVARHNATPSRERIRDVLCAINKDYWQGPTSAAAPIRWDRKVDIAVIPASKF